jgi:pilus assembly protein CpaB
MGPVRVLVLAVALAAAIGAVIVVRTMGRAQPAHAAAVVAAPVEKPTAQVLVARRDLKPGTKLKAEDLTWQAWPQESLNPAFIVQSPETRPAGEAQKIAAAASDLAKTAVGAPDDKVTALVGSVVREPILASEPIIERKLVRAGTAGVMAVALEPGMRAMAVPLSAESAAGGFILPGDHVDVVQSRQIEGAARRFVSQTVLKNVRVLAIDQNVAAKGASVVGATATLEVDPTQAEVLTLAKAEGALTLVLRSYADIAGPTITVARGGGAAAGAGEAFVRASVVRVFRNGQASEMTVSQ